MRTLSSTLLAAQQSATQTPSVKIGVKNKMTGVTRFIWEKLYQGIEDESYHGMTVAGDGSLIRARISLSADGLRLYRQRVSSPGPQSDFSNWTDTNQHDCLTVALASHGSEVSIIWINSSRELRRLKSTNNGVSWSSPEVLDYSTSTNVHGLTAAYKSNGDMAVFFTDQATLNIKKYAGGIWQALSAWDKTTGCLSSVSAVYDGDWNLLVTGQDTNGNFKVWSLIYGDGGDVPSGGWSAFQELASAPAGGDFEYGPVFLDKPDVYRAFYVEKFSGVQSYNRPFGTYSVPDTVFTESLWHEPESFNLSCEYGLATAHSGNYGWLSTANGVWRTSLAEASLDITSDILSVKYEILPKEGRLLVDLRNDDSKYQSPGEGNLEVLKIGSQLEFSPGYVTASGHEISPGPVFRIDGWEHISAGGKSCLTLHGIDGWNLLENWRAMHQFRWNQDSEEMSVKQILSFVLARAGLKLEVKSESSASVNFYPDFTIHPDDRGNLIILRLLSFIPDMIFFESVRAYLVNPQSSDSSVYSYGQSHVILQGKYYTGSWQTNQVRLEGYDAVNGVPIITDAFSWEQMALYSERVKQITDRNIGTVPAGQTLAGVYLRKAEIESVNGMLQSPVNCGQQLYDVIDITDNRAGLSAVKKRVMGIIVSYVPERGEYEQKLILGGV
jgi:hypothetical protein